MLCIVARRGPHTAPLHLGMHTSDTIDSCPMSTRHAAGVVHGLKQRSRKTRLDRGAYLAVHACMHIYLPIDLCLCICLISVTSPFNSLSLYLLISCPSSYLPTYLSLLLSVSIVTYTYLHLTLHFCEHSIYIHLYLTRPTYIFLYLHICIYLSLSASICKLSVPTVDISIYRAIDRPICL